MFQLQIDEKFEVPVAKLFQAWTQANMIKKWFAPGDMTVPEAQTDLRIGGQYRYVMQEPEGDQHIILGEFLEIIEDSQLSFSWQWEGAPNKTRVDIYFEKLDDSHSSLKLVHSEFLEQEACDKHQMGWNGCLANLHNNIK